MWGIKLDHKFSAISIGSVALLSAIFIYVGFFDYKNFEKKEAELAKLVPQSDIKKINYFEDLSLEAKAVYVYDVNSKKVLYQKNAETPLPLASITKVMTAVIAEEEALGKTITIDSIAISTDGDSGLEEGENWDINKLLSFMLISSSNDGAVAIAGLIDSFVNKMNDKAALLGLSTLSFNNPTGLDIEEIGDTGGYGSAEDVAKLFEYSVKNHYPLIKETSNPVKEFTSDTLVHEAKNTNTSLNTMPHVLASKTGYTAKAGGNLGIVFDRGLNEPVVIVVLGSSYDGRFKDVANLASSTLRTYNQWQ